MNYDDPELMQKHIDEFTRELAEAISPCVLCGQPILASDLVSKVGHDKYAHSTCAKQIGAMP